jgi:hypothetical protein
VFPVRYELGFYISEGGILHGYSRENLKASILKGVVCDEVTENFPSDF